MAVSFFLILNLIPFTAPVDAGDGGDEEKARVRAIETTDDRFGGFDDGVDLLVAVYNGEKGAVLGFAFLEEIAHAGHQRYVVAEGVAQTSETGAIEHGYANYANIFPSVKHIVTVINIVEDE